MRHTSGLEARDNAAALNSTVGTRRIGELSWRGALLLAWLVLLLASRTGGGSLLAHGGNLQFCGLHPCTVQRGVAVVSNREHVAQSSCRAAAARIACVATCGVAGGRLPALRQLTASWTAATHQLAP